MSSHSKNRDGSKSEYSRAKCIVFLKTKEAFGGLSNMAGGFPLLVNSIQILTSEALYQACRFPHLPAIQQEIIIQKSPMAAKMKSKPHRGKMRMDWDQVNVNIMRWCLKVKLAQNWDSFSALLLETEGRSIVEQSRKDAFWGAKPIDDNTLVGMNVLGQLLMELRESIKTVEKEKLLLVDPLAIPDFLLDGQPIERVDMQNTKNDPSSTMKTGDKEQAKSKSSHPEQLPLFDSPSSNSKEEA